MATVFWLYIQQFPVACLCLVQADTVNVDWKYGMEDADTAVCVPPGMTNNIFGEI
jgi:hypothetical protein